MPFHILWGDNVSEIMWYFKYCTVRLQVQWALQKVGKGVIVANLLQSEQATL